MLSLEKIDEIITEFKENNDNEYENINKIILPQSKTNLNKICQRWNKINEKYYKDANINSNILKKKENYNICQPFPSENNENDTQNLKCFTRGNILSNCDNKIPYHYVIILNDSEKGIIFKNNKEQFLNNKRKMNKLNEIFINLINTIQELKNKITDSTILNDNNKKLKSIVNRTDNNKTDQLDEKNKEILIEKSKLDDLSEQNNNMEAYVRRLSSIAKFVFILMIIIMVLTNIAKLNLTASIALAIINIGIIALVYLLVFEKKSYITKIIPPIKD